MFPKRLVAASFEPLMLSLLARGEMYGYQIIQQIQALSGGQIQWTANRLYPLLHDLENRGLVEATWQDEATGRKRKYYQLTPDGVAALAATKQQWQGMQQLFERLWDTSTPLPLLPT